MLNNLNLFNECLQNRVPNIDRIAWDVLNRTVIPIERDIYSELLAKNYELIELIKKYNNLNVLGNLCENENIINLIDECLCFDGMNLCPFSQYLMNHDYSDIIFQVMIDNYSHKRKAVIGVEKIRIICEENGIYHFNGNFDDFFFLVTR